MSLRETNKVSRQKRIVANAASFFSSIGYDLTAIEMVAERSNVSPAVKSHNVISCQRAARLQYHEALYGYYPASGLRRNLMAVPEVDLSS